jgi:hypothetical protein
MSGGVSYGAPGEVQAVVEDVQDVIASNRGCCRPPDLDIRSFSTEIDPLVTMCVLVPASVCQRISNMASGAMGVSE